MLHWFNHQINQFNCGAGFKPMLPRDLINLWKVCHIGQNCQTRFQSQNCLLNWQPDQHKNFGVVFIQIGGLELVLLNCLKSAIFSDIARFVVYPSVVTIQLVISWEVTESLCLNLCTNHAQNMKPCFVINTAYLHPPILLITCLLKIMYKYSSLHQ